MKLFLSLLIRITDCAQFRSEHMSNFWMVRYLKTESEPIFSFPHTPDYYTGAGGHCSQLMRPRVSATAMWYVYYY